MRAERRAIVEIGAPVPLAIPGVPFDVGGQLDRLGAAQFGKRGVAAQAGHGREILQHLVQEEGQPHAFTLAVLADLVHAIVPVAGTDQRQAPFAEAQAVLDGAHAMLVQIARLA